MQTYAQYIESRIEHCVELGKIQIDDDLAMLEEWQDREGPKSFSELHDVVDANYYGDLLEPENDDLTIMECAEVQDRLDAWIKGGMR